MATYYALSGNMSSSTAYSLTSGGAHGSTTPTAADDIILDGNSGALTIDANLSCRSFDCQAGTANYSGTLTHNAGVTLSLGTGSVNPSGVSLRFSPSMTYTLGSQTTSAITWVGTSGTQETITTAGKVIGLETFSGVGGSWIFADNFNGGTSQLTHTGGTLNFNNTGLSHTFGGLTSSGSSARTLTLGTAAITINAAGNGLYTSGSNLTITANTAVITFTYATGTANLNYYNLNGASLVFTSSNTTAAQLLYGGTCANLTVSGPSNKTGQLLLSGNFTVKGTLTLGGNSTQGSSRLIVTSNTIGSTRTFTLTGAAVVINGDVDFQDISIAGSPSWTNTGNAFIGDCGGNSGITFTTAATQTWQGTSGGNWSDPTKWTSRVPLPQDNVSIASAFLSAQTITTDMPRLGKSIDFTGTTWSGTPFQLSGAAGMTSTFYGSLTFVAGITTAGPSGSAWVLAGRGSYTFTPPTTSVAAPLSVFAYGGTYGLQGSYVGYSFALSSGTFTTNSYNMTCTTSFVCIAQAGQTVTFNGGTTSFVVANGSLGAGTSYVINIATAGLTWNGQGVAFVIGHVQGATTTLAVNAPGVSLGSLSYTLSGSVAPMLIGSGGLAPSIGTLNFGDASNARTLTIAHGATLTITGTGAGQGWQVQGSGNGNVTLNSDSAGTAARIALPNVGGWGSVDLTVQDITVTGDTLYARSSTNVSDNSGIVFGAATYTRSVSETDPTAADAWSHVFSRTRSVSESSAASDALGRGFSGGRVVNESVSASDAVTRTTPAARSVSESSAASDAVSRTLRVTRSVSESSVASDAVSRLAAFRRSLAENAGPAIDAVSGVFTYTSAGSVGIGEQAAYTVGVGDS